MWDRLLSKTHIDLLFLLCTINLSLLSFQISSNVVPGKSKMPGANILHPSHWQRSPEAFFHCWTKKENLPTPLQKLARFDFDSLIGGPIVAMVTAQVQYFNHNAHPGMRCFM